MSALPPAVTAALNRFAAIDLARLPARPVTARTYDAIYAAYMADLSARMNAEGIPYNVAGTAGNVVNLVTDTNAITGRSFAYMVEGVEADRDEAIAAVLTPWSYGAYLDALGAQQDPPVPRKAIVAEPRPFDDYPEDWQSDDDYRALVLFAPEALSTCGPEGAYLWFALQTPGVLAASVYGPMSFGGTKAVPFIPPGEVHVPVLAFVGDGTAPPELVAAAAAEVTAESRRPIADFVTVSAAAVLVYALPLTLYCGAGVDVETVGRTALARLRALADLQHRPGGSMLLQAIYAAALVPDDTGRPVVGYVDPGDLADINPGPVSPANPGPAYVAPYCPPGDGTLADATATRAEDGSLLIAWGGITLRMVQTYG